jgi:hypothetical protein
MDDQQNPESLEQVPTDIPDTFDEETVEIQENSDSPLKHNWPLIAVGTIMLLVGLMLGYIGRGVYGPEAVAAKKTTATAVAAIQTRAAANKEVMAMLIGATRHFKGDANAPVTIIEFSDYQ